MPVRTRLVLLVGLVIAGVIGSPALAQAEDAWPTAPDYPSPVTVYETDRFLTPTDPAYWNPLVDEYRLTSPYGTGTRIVCKSFLGGTAGCWQADRGGNPHQLAELPVNFPHLFSTQWPGYAPKHFVYPFWTTGS